jgi:HD-GYP domain-containing protein (c-di-GMP phosphodiesterase class II)
MSSVSTSSLYSREHPSVGEQMEDILSHLANFFTNRANVPIMIVGDELVVNEMAIKNPGIHEKNLLKKMKRKGFSRIELLRGLTGGELLRFIGDLGSPGEIGGTYSHIKLGFVSVRFGKRGAGSVDPSTGTVEEERILPGLSPEDLPEEIINEVKDTFHNISPFRKMNTSGLEELVMNFIGTFRKEVNILKLISPVRTYSEYTYTHATNVSILAMIQAETIGIKGSLLRDIGISALLHDVGKLFVPTDILEKKGKLDEKEFEEIKKHTIYGAKYLTLLDGVTPLAAIVAYEHHMRYDGNGYPEKRSFRKVQHVCSQIVQVSDFFDALRSKRPYKRDWSIEEIITLMRESSGTIFNSSLINNLSRILSSALGDSTQQGEV